MSEPYYICGELTYSQNIVPVIFPYTGERFAEVCIAAGATDQGHAADSAVLGFLKTKNIPVHTRAGILQQLADLMKENREEFVFNIVHESGKPLRQAHLEVTRAVHVIRVSADEALRIVGEIILPGGGYTGLLPQSSRGPCALHHPVQLSPQPHLPQDRSGNRCHYCSFVLKPTTKTPLTALLLGRDPRFGGSAPAAIHHDADITYAARRIAEGASHRQRRTELHQRSAGLSSTTTSTTNA